jgi:hypothetical protein
MQPKKILQKKTNRFYPESPYKLQRYGVCGVPTAISYTTLKRTKSYLGNITVKEITYLDLHGTKKRFTL